MIVYLEAKILIAVDLPTKHHTIEEVVESFQEEVEESIVDTVLAEGADAVSVVNWEWKT